MRLLFSVLTLCLFATPAFAAVTISEVAWMGSETSANDEWIELHNDGAAVPVDGWLLSDGMNLDVVLAGTVPANAYVVLERTDDGSAPGTAFFIYTGALGNAGATLSLYNENDSLVDRVVGGEDWENIGGDNTTKETAQYTSEGWVTAAATPGAAAEEMAQEADEASNTASGNTTFTSGNPVVARENTRETSSLHRKQRTPEVLVTGPSRAYPNQEVTFAVETSGVAKSISASLKHEWNFGDTYTGTGRTVSHRFAYPGEYIVTLYSSYKQYEAESRFRVVVLPATLSLGLNARGNVQLHNDARYEIDISGYTLVSDRTFMIPPRTIISPGSTITIPEKKLLKRHGGFVSLKDQAGLVVATVGSAKAPKVVDAEPVRESVVAAQPQPGSFSFASERDVRLTQAATTSVPDLVKNSGGAAVIESVPESTEVQWPYFALLGVIGLGVLALFAGRVAV